MATVRVRQWTLRCFGCDWETTRLFGDNQGHYDVKKTALKQHTDTHFVKGTQCPLDGVGVEVEEVR